MKKILRCLIIVVFLLMVGEVKALSFKEGEFLNGEYINKVKDGKTYYMTVQYIYRDDGKVVYCLEPFANFITGNGYIGYNFNYDGVTGLSKEQVRRIELLSYYGFNYHNRSDSKWYAITQYLIWKTVSNDDIYFTDKLNGKRINKYETEIKELEQDIANNEIKPSFLGQEVTVNYGDDVNLEDTSKILNDYQVLGKINYNYQKEGNTFKISNVMQSGRIAFKRQHTLYNSNSFVYINSNSQNLFAPGNPREAELYLKLNVTAGDVELKIKDDDSVYSIAKDFSNTCYGLYNLQNELLDKVCTEQSLNYKSNLLKYGVYYVKQLSVGKGYEKDEKIYSFEINSRNEHIVLELQNKLIRNTIKINKKYCKKDVCSFEKNAKFNIFDEKDNLIGSIETDANGNGAMELGYGKYYGVQILGKEGYQYVDDFEFAIINGKDQLKYEFIDNLKLSDDKNNETVEDDTNDLEMLPPETGIDNVPSLKKIIINFLHEIINFMTILWKKW